jgi:DNA-binding transcriptional LysR family regulator
MTLEQLRAFLAVARMGGVRKAAEQMNISQPAISARISSLEDYLGTRLFSRETTGVSLTAKGVVLRDYAEQIMAITERIKGDVMSDDSISSLLRLGVAETIAQTWLPDFLQRFTPRFSGSTSRSRSIHRSTFGKCCSTGRSI